MTLKKIKLFIVCIPFLGPIIALVFVDKNEENQLFYIKLSILMLQLVILPVFLLFATDILMLGAFPRLSFALSMLHNVIVSLYLVCCIVLVYFVFSGKGIKHQMLQKLAGLIKI